MNTALVLCWNPSPPVHSSPPPRDFEDLGRGILAELSAVTPQVGTQTGALLHAKLLLFSWGPPKSKETDVLDRWGPWGIWLEM